MIPTSPAPLRLVAAAALLALSVPAFARPSRDTSASPSGSVPEWPVPAAPAANEPAVSPAQALEIAMAEARRRGWTAPAGGLHIATASSLYGVGFFDAVHAHGDGGLGNPWLYLDARAGALVCASTPGEGSAGDVFMQSMFPLHSGRILGLPGRVLVSFMGIAVASFSLTGVLNWARKRGGRACIRTAA